MSEIVLHLKTTRADIRQALAGIPLLARAGGDVANAMLGDAGNALLRRIKEAFLIKMGGGTDETGERWAPLSPRTIAKRGKRRKIDILRDTGKLLRTLSPGSTIAEKVFRVAPGSVTIGTSRKGAAAHHKGVPLRNLPQRRLWPKPKNWPPGWKRDILEPLRAGVVKLIVKRLRELS